MKHKVALAIVATASGAALLLNSPASASTSTSTVSHTRSGSITTSGLTVTYKHGCVNITDKTDQFGPEIWYSPMWDFKVVENGQPGGGEAAHLVHASMRPRPEGRGEQPDFA